LSRFALISEAEEYSRPSSPRVFAAGWGEAGDALAGFWPAILLLIVVVVGWFGGRQLFRLAEGSFWSLRSPCSPAISWRRVQAEHRASALDDLRDQSPGCHVALQSSGAEDLLQLVQSLQLQGQRVLARIDTRVRECLAAAVPRAEGAVP
jgi:hypothetical protein